MNLSLSTFPDTLDMLHLLLGLSVLFLLIIITVRRAPVNEKAAVIADAKTGESAAASAAVPAPSVATAPEVKPAPVALAAANLRSAEPESALQLLGLFQQEARLIDFLQEDLKGFSDAEVGAAARVIHEGGRRLLGEYIRLSPVRSESEESRVTLAPGFDASEVRLTGNVTGQPPFTGTLLHRGWRVDAMELPRLAEGRRLNIIAPAEVEL